MPDTAAISPDQCASGPSDDLTRLFAQASRTRTPLVVSFALTHRCSFHCRHCYLGDQMAIRGHRREELTTEVVFGLLDQMAKAGTLLLTLTGGDPMIRPDFIAIYEYAVRLGLLVSVYCNGSLITDPIIRSFRKYPPRKIEVSIYGATEETFAEVTLTKDGWMRFQSGIDRLRDAGIRYTLKTPVMTQNVRELPAMREIAAHRGVHFRHDVNLTACLANADNGGNANGDSGPRPLLSPLEYRLPPEEAARIDGSTAELRAALKDGLGKGVLPTGDDKLYHCGAAAFSFHIDPYGWMQPCIIATEFRYDLGQGTILDGWNGPLARFREQTAGAAYACNDCLHRPVCGGCPANFALESGDPERPTPFYCRSAAARHEIALAP